MRKIKKHALVTYLLIFVIIIKECDDTNLKDFLNFLNCNESIYLSFCNRIPIIPFEILTQQYRVVVLHPGEDSKTCISRWSVPG